MTRTSSLTLYVLALTASSAAFADGAWVNIATTDGNAAGLSSIPGVPADAQWVPNQFNNPLIGPTGIVTFRGQLAGTGIQSTAPNNSHIFVSGLTGGAGLSQIARAGNALPSGLASGLVCNTTTGTNGLGSTHFQAGNGGVLITGNLNGTGVTSTTSPTKGTALPRAQAQRSRGVSRSRRWKALGRDDSSNGYSLRGAPRRSANTCCTRRQSTPWWARATCR